MSDYLLDVNVLIALFHKPHVAHRRAQAWFLELAGRPWATCALTQSGFVRIASNRTLFGNAINLADALAMLDTITRLPGHRFWPMDISLAEAVQPFEGKLFGHRQVTDAYLLGLSIKRKGRLVTLDRGIAALAGSEFARHVAVL